MTAPILEAKRTGLAATLLLAAILSAGCASTLRFRYQPRMSAPGADLVSALAIASGFQAVEGNSAELLENGRTIFPSMLDAIREAKSSIHLETYIFRNGEVGRAFVEALAERGRAGVKVRLLLDAFGSSGLGSANESTLAAAGVQLHYFRPFTLRNLFKAHIRTHRKVLIVDGQIGFVGGVCIDDAWLGDADRADRWRETEVRVEGPVVRQMQITFARSWLEMTGDLLSARVLFTASPAGDLTCQTLDSIPGTPINSAGLSYLVAVSAAKQSIDITNAYFVPRRSLRKALREAAGRGVRVRLILSSRNNDSKTIRYTGRTYYGKLLEAGVEIYEYQPSRLHSKTIVVDGAWASVGSTNLDHRSFAWNYETNVNIFDAGFASKMEDMFERDLGRSKEVTLEEWRKRPLSEKILEKFSGIFRWQY